MNAIALDIGPIFMRRAPSPLPARRPLPMVDGKRPKQPPLVRAARPPVLRKHDWTQLETALALAADGFEAEGREMLADLEQRIGVTVHDRITWAGHTNVAGADEAAARVRSEGRRLRVEQREQRLRAEALRSDRHLPPTDDALAAANASLEALAEAVRAYQRGDLKESARQRGIAKQKQDEADADRARQLELASQRQAAADREELAGVRGEELIVEEVDMKVPVLIAIPGVEEGQMLVEREQRVLRVRNVTRDGLASLRQERKRQEAEEAKTGKKATGGLTLRQYQAGVRYRTMYEDRDGPLGSQMGQMFGKSGGRQAVAVENLRVPKALASRVDARRRFDALEAEVSASDRSGRRLQVLRDVAGRGKNISELASSGSAKVALRKALASALDVVVEHLHRTRG